MIRESEYKGYPIQVKYERFWVGDQDHDDIGAARQYIDEELVGTGTTPDRVRALFRLHHEVERGEKLLHYQDVAITIRDDDRGWTYNVEQYQTRNLEEIMAYAEGVARLDPVQRRVTDMIVEFGKDAAEEICRRLSTGESLDLAEEYSMERLQEKIRSTLEAEK